MAARARQIFTISRQKSALHKKVTLWTSPAPLDPTLFIIASILRSLNQRAVGGYKSVQKSCELDENVSENGTLLDRSY